MPANPDPTMEEVARELLTNTCLMTYSHASNFDGTATELRHKGHDELVADIAQALRHAKAQGMREAAEWHARLGSAAKSEHDFDMAAYHSSSADAILALAAETEHPT